MQGFSNIEIILLMAYFIVIWVIGFISARKESVADYLIASRKVGLIRTTASIVAVMGGMVLIAQAALSFEMGSVAMWYWAGIALGMIGMGVAVKKIKRIANKNKFLVLSDYFFNKFDKKTGMLSAIVMFLALYAVLVGQFIAAGSLFSPLIGINYSFAVIIMAIGTLIYLLAGGFSAVVRTDLVQFFLMIFVLVAVAVNLRLDLLGLTSSNRDSSISLVVVFVIMGFFAVISGPDLWQRVFSSRNTRTARFACFLSAGIFVLFGLALTVIGLAAKTHFPNINANQALFYGLFNLVPAQLVVFVIIAVLAAIMSTIDTELFYLSLSVSKDFLRNKEGKHMVRNVRLIVFGLAVLSALTAILFSDILVVLFGLVSLLLAITPSFLASLKWKLKSNAVFLSLSAGLFSLILLIVTETFSPDTSAITLPVAALFLLIGQLFFRKSSD